MTLLPDVESSPRSARPVMPPAAPRLREANRTQVCLRPVDLEGLLPEAHRASIVWAYVEGLDLTPLYLAAQAVESEAGRPAPSALGTFGQFGFRGRESNPHGSLGRAIRATTIQIGPRSRRLSYGPSSGTELGGREKVGQGLATLPGGTPGLPDRRRGQLAPDARFCCESR